MRISEIFELGQPGNGSRDGDGRNPGSRFGISVSRGHIFVQIGRPPRHHPNTGGGSMLEADQSTCCSQRDQSSPASLVPRPVSASHGASWCPPLTRFAAPAAVKVTNPTSVSIPQIEANSNLIALGLNFDRTLQVPDVHKPGQAGWYSDGVKPGHVGPAIIVGHVNGGGQKGVFFRLHELVVGNTVQIGQSDGAMLTFRVVEVETMPKAEFQTAKVYGDVDRPALRIITCGGRFVGGELGYADNVVVFADLVH